jgi:hypothetical protein
VTGLRHEDMGRWPVLDANGNTYMAYRDHYKWKIGLTVRDWRYVVRIANIDVSDLATGSAANLINALVRAGARLPTTPVGLSAVQTSDAPSIRGTMGRTVIYCNRTISTYLRLQAMNKTNVLLATLRVARPADHYLRRCPDPYLGRHPQHRDPCGLRRRT